jgi:hypothetical protein
VLDACALLRPDESKSDVLERTSEGHGAVSRKFGRGEGSDKVILEQ